MGNLNDVINDLQEKSSDDYIKNITKLGIPEKDVIGVPTTELRKIAKLHKNNNSLIPELWDSGYHECKILAVLLMKPDEYSKEQIENYMNLVYSWDLCDLYCKSVIIKRNDYADFINDWITSKEIYRKRGSFSLLASTSVHKKLTPIEIEFYLNLISSSDIPDETIIKKSASWALRELGKIDEDSNIKSIEVAEYFKNRSEKSYSWIGKDALKELVTLIKVPGRERLISRNSKMGKEHINSLL